MTTYTDPYGGNLTDEDIVLMHDDLLDELYPAVTIGIYQWSPSFALKRLDPVAYGISVIEYRDQMLEDNQIVEV